MSSSRRTFAKAIVVGSAALPLVATDVLAQSAAAPAAPPPTGAKVPETPAAKPSPIARAMTEVVRAEGGPHLSDEEMTRIAKEFEDYAPFLERLRAFKLTNADEPDTTFQALTERW
jgi:hypothetical protein